MRYCSLLLTLLLVACREAPPTQLFHQFITEDLIGYTYGEAELLVSDQCSLSGLSLYETPLSPAHCPPDLVNQLTQSPSHPLPEIENTLSIPAEQADQIIHSPNDWDHLYTRYTNASGLLLLSPIVTERDQALFHYLIIDHGGSTAQLGLRYYTRDHHGTWINQSPAPTHLHWD